MCPNRANVTVEIAGANGGLAPLSHQIVHIDRMCNECGNCAVFCPHSGKPYRDKLTIFCSGEDFADSENPGFLKTGPGAYRIRLEDKSLLEYHRGEKNIPAPWIDVIETIETRYGYLIT